jgi:lipoteichoic acid synthase
MSDITLVLIVFIVSSCAKALFTYLTLQLNYHLLLLHVATSLGSCTIWVLLTLKCRRPTWFITWYLLHAFYLFVNANFFQFFGKFLHLTDMYILVPEVLVLAKNLGIPLDRSDLLFILDFPLFLYLLHKHRNRELPLRHANAAILGAAGVTLLASVFVITAPLGYRVPSARVVEDSEIISRYGFLGHNLYDLLLAQHSSREDQIHYGPIITGSGTPGRRPNIVMIQFESLDANIVNYRYQGRYVAPFLHGLTTSSVYFPFTLCYRLYGGTSDCEVAVNNSIEPLLDFPLIKDERYGYPNALVKVLKKNGYSADAYHGNVGWYYNRLSAYSAMGYDHFYDSNIMKLPLKAWGVSDQQVLQYAAQRLPAVQKPFFVSVITLTSHEPFDRVEQVAPDHRFDGVEPVLTKRYFESIAYSDRVVGEFVTEIRKKYPDTYFFIYGDHTPFVINEGSFQRSVLRRGKGVEMVPLFIITPDGRSHYERGAVASYLDFAPTILQATGVPYRYRSLGVDLLAPNSLRLPVSYRGDQYDRAGLFNEMVRSYPKALE